MTLRFGFYLLLLLAVFTNGIVRYKRLTTPFRILTFFVGLTFISESLSRICGIIIRNSAPVNHVFAVIEYGFLAYIYFNLFTNKFQRFIALYSILLIFVIEIINLLFFEHILQYPSITLSISEAAYILLSLFLFKQMLGNPIEVPLSKQSLFWFNIAVFLFSCIIFLAFGLMNPFLKSRIDTKVLDWFIYWVNIVYYVLFGIAITIDSKMNFGKSR